ncbi:MULTISPECIES: hypothetical protein [Chelativorans]|jgi:hypothetical protein|uniref:Uncharacterized protein n=1 Tax=Chelativorans sp. (strain BNC1) TaxID=266779 RepID=Q11D16_CHESB|nr:MULTISPECIES: hypothetical protein [Chelativorans]
MLPVNFNTSAVTSLNILKSMQNIDIRPDAAAKRPAAGPSPLGRNSLSPTTADAILRIKELVSSSTGAPNGALSLSELPATHADKLRGYGDSFVRLDEKGVDQATFEKMVFNLLQENHSDDPTFLAAVKNGNLTISRPSEVAGLGEGSVTYAAYSNGQYTGSVGFSHINKDFYLFQEGKGLTQIFGYHELVGSFYVTWPK